MSLFNKNKFIYVMGKKLYQPNGKEFIIKSIGFGNNVWYTQNAVPTTDHDEQSYKELADLGFNSVRFYINAALFEIEGTPYVYNESAFKWLRQNIKWAKKYNIKILINLHIPQGGKFSSSNVDLWVKDGYQDRFTALWKEIARRCSKETAILGYGLLGDPYVSECTTSDEALRMYYNLINTTVDKIRTVDKNHVLFVERPYGTVNPATKKVSYVWGDTGSFRLINDKNTVYEFHFYERNEFVYQGLNWQNYRKKWVYGSDEIALLSGTRTVVRAYISNPANAYDNTSNVWQYMESKLITPGSPTENYGYWMVYASHLGSEGTLRIDDIVVKEYNEKKEYVRDIYQLSFDHVTACEGWDLGLGGGGSYSYNSADGHNRPGCAQIKGALKSYRIYNHPNLANYFPLKQGYYYKICAYVKFMDTNADAAIQLALSACHADKVFAFNKTYLDHRLSDYIKLGITNNVPMYLGEFGVPHHLMGNEYKGEEWVTDMFELLNHYRLNYNYHDYHEDNFGLYTNDSRYPRADRNEILYQIFTSHVS